MNKILFIMYFFIIMVLSLVNLIINKYNSGIVGLHCSNTVAHTLLKGRNAFTAKTFEDHQSPY
jgi:hypothetical protein